VAWTPRVVFKIRQRSWKNQSILKVNLPEIEAYPANSKLPRVDKEATVFGFPRLVFLILRASPAVDVEATRIVKADPVVNAVADIEAAAPTVRELDLKENEPG
jgi:hypothetical protein